MTNLEQMRARIAHYRRNNDASGPVEIGCRVLTQPFFLPEDQWIEPPKSWSPNIVQFRGYDTDDDEGAKLWDAIRSIGSFAVPSGLGERSQGRYGEPALVRPRLGQGAFRLLVTDIYGRRCAVTGERTLPALEAAHIKPFADGGEHLASNGLLLRRDIHSLFDAGYVTVSAENRFEVSRRIREDFENGRDYYALHGKSLTMPPRADLRPSPEALRWHNEKRFLT